MSSLPASQLLALINKYFGPDNANKWLYLINGESGGNPTAVGDGGAAYGLFQSHYIPPGTPVEQQFQDAARLYRNDLANGGTGFGDWGEGRTYNGQPFGALGNHPYSGALNAAPPINTDDIHGNPPTIPTNLSDILNRATIGKYQPNTAAPQSSLLGIQGIENNPRFSPIRAGLLGSNYIDPTQLPSFPMPKMNRWGANATSTLIPKPSPAGLMGNHPDLQGKSFDDQYWYLVEHLVDITTKIDEAQAAYDADPNRDTYTTLQNLQIQAGIISKSMDSLDKARSAGLVSSGVDAAKAFIAADTGKQQASTTAYKDFSDRVGDLVAAGIHGNNWADQAIKDITSAGTDNANRAKDIISGGIGRTDLPIYSVNTSGYNPTFDLTGPLAGLRNSIPNTPPAIYQPNLSLYDNLAKAIASKQNVSSVLGSSPNSMYIDPTSAYNPQSPFGV